MYVSSVQIHTHMHSFAHTHLHLHTHTYTHPPTHTPHTHPRTHPLARAHTHTFMHNNLKGINNFYWIRHQAIQKKSNITKAQQIKFLYPFPKCRQATWQFCHGPQVHFSSAGLEMEALANLFRQASTLVEFWSEIYISHNTLIS